MAHVGSLIYYKLWIPRAADRNEKISRWDEVRSAERPERPMTEIASLLLAVTLISGSGQFSQPSGFDSYALQSCLSNCYATFRPTRQPTDYANCVNRCKRAHEERQKQELERLKRQEQDRKQKSGAYP